MEQQVIPKKPRGIRYRIRDWTRTTTLKSWKTKPNLIPNVVVLVVLGQAEHVLGQKLGLLRIGQTQLGSQVQDLELDHNFLVDEGLGHLAEHIRRDFRNPIGVLADDPQDGGSGLGHLDGVDQLGHVNDDVLVVASLRLQKFLDNDDRLSNNSLKI